MHSSFVHFFVDPETKEPLDLQIIQCHEEFIDVGFLVNNASGKRYPIIRGIPRFVDHDSQNYSSTFGYQWQKWSRVQFEAENIGKPMQGHTKLMWEKIVGAEDRGWDFLGGTFLDIGCGPGRFLDVAVSRGAKVIGVDYSAAVEAARKNFLHNPNVCICQADALNLPIRSESLDGAYSIGVLHHTPDPIKGLQEAARVLKPDNWFALSVYGKRGYYDFPSVQAWRKIFSKLWPFFRHYPPLIYTYVTCYCLRPIAMQFPTFGKALRLIFPFVKLPDLNWSLLDTFDSITPSYQSAHESYEVYKWFIQSGFVDVRPSDWGFTSFTGIKEQPRPE